MSARRRTAGSAHRGPAHRRRDVPRFQTECARSGASAFCACAKCVLPETRRKGFPMGGASQRDSDCLPILATICLHRFHKHLKDFKYHWPDLRPPPKITVANQILSIFWLA